MKNLVILIFLSGFISIAEIKECSAQIKLEQIEIYGSANKAAISEKVTKAFDRAFKDATDVTWYVVNKQIIVNFILNDQKNKAVFQKNGLLVYHLVYGTEKQMPEDVRRVVKSKYYDQKINSTINVKTEDRSVWIVNVSDPKEITVLKIENGTMEVKDKFPNSEAS